MGRNVVISLYRLPPVDPKKEDLEAARSMAVICSLVLRRHSPAFVAEFQEHLALSLEAARRTAAKARRRK